MTLKNLAAGVLSLLLWACFSGSVTAGTLSGKIRVNDEFSLYLSTDDNTEGEIIAKVKKGNGTFAFDIDLEDGQNYYLHISGKSDKKGDVAGLLADLNLSGGAHFFADNSSHVLSNTTDWKVGDKHWQNYVPASDSNGRNGTSSTEIDENATWIWSSNTKDKKAYFSIKISTQQAISHYQIEHDSQGLTCEAQTINIKACANTDCSELYSEPSTLGLSPSGWVGGDRVKFTGSINPKLRVLTASTVTFTKTPGAPDVPLRCFTGSGDNRTETCEMTFVDAGFEFVGAQSTDKRLPDQLGEQSFVNANLRAVQNNNGVCEALLEGSQDITLGVDCVSPGRCLTPFSNIDTTLAPDGETTGQVRLTFAANGIASLNPLYYADAGRLALSAQAEVEGVTITSGRASVDVLPKYLVLNAQPEALLNNTPDPEPYPAGEGFLFTIGAYGVLGNDPLPNYQPGQLQMAVKRTSQDAANSVDGQFSYAKDHVISSSLAEPSQFYDTLGLQFTQGQYSDQANYSEVGVINVDVQDAAYLPDPQKSPRLISALQPLMLGAFRPAYFEVDIDPNVMSPTLADTCGTFSYVGQEIAFEVEPSYRLTAKNAQGVITKNYTRDYWHYTPDVAKGLGYLDSSTYANTGSATVISSGLAVVPLDGKDVYDGSASIVIEDGSFRYNKVKTDFQPFALTEPFAASIDLKVSALMLTDSDGVCYQSSYPDGCESYSIIDITGTSVHHGRLILEPNFGPETEFLIAPLKAQHYINGSWQFNANDSCTDVAMQQSDGEIVLTAVGDTDITGNIDPVISVGDLVAGKVEGVANFSLGQIVPGQTQRQGPGVSGLVKVALDPDAGNVTWPDYMNFDWNTDGLICANSMQCPPAGGVSPALDGPSSTLSFGAFRGNDRIIHWREVFN
jgi:MSHA biogenesis protein MshQ